MGIAHQVDTWSKTHHPGWFVVLRAGLGLCLFIKGIQFIYNTILLNQIFAQSSFLSHFAWIGTAIPYLHLLGGALLLMGLFTRFVCLLHIPVLLGAVFMTSAEDGFFAGGSDQLFSMVVLLLLCLFFVEGGGYYSLDSVLRNKDSRPL